MRNIAYYNGEISTLEELKIPVLDRAVYFGDGVYDVAFIDNGHFFALDEHIDRFMNSCRLIEIEPPCSREELEEIFCGLIAKLEGIKSGILYWQASRATANRDHPYPTNAKANLLVWIKEKGLPDIKVPLKLMTVPDVRYSLCHIKTINLLPNVIASQRAVEAGCDEAVQIRDGVVTECAHSNISIIKDGVFITHPLDCRILPGIARKHVLALCRELGIPVEEREYGLNELMNADEIIVTSTTKLCSAANVLDGYKVGGKAPELVEKIQDAYQAKVLRETL